MTRIATLVGLAGFAAVGCSTQATDSATGSTAHSLKHLSDAQCVAQVSRVRTEFERALSGQGSVVGGYFTDSKFNPCTCGGQLEQHVHVTTVTGTDWHASPMWSFKAAERFEFAGGDLVFVDTKTAYHNVQCADGRVYWSNWLQWVTGNTVSEDQCSTLGCGAGYPNWESWCGPLLVCPTDSYCTSPESGATCPG